jgi:hypothetical protein
MFDITNYDGKKCAFDKSQNRNNRLDERMKYNNNKRQYPAKSWNYFNIPITRKVFKIYYDKENF